MVLGNVNCRIYWSKVNVLIGENGTGKSTTTGMPAGVESPPSEQIIMDGVPVTLNLAHQTKELGINIVFQELSLFPNINVMGNIFMANEFFQKGETNGKYQYTLTKSLLERLELDVDPYAPLEGLETDCQQLVEIVRTFSRDTCVLITDKPASALSQPGVRVLSNIIEQLRRHDVITIYISHRLEELMEIGDYITILHDGRFISKRPANDASIPWIIERMVGDKKEHFSY